MPSPEEDWIVVENAHESIISQELWDTVQQLMKSRKRENSSGEVQMFAGLVKCSKCGSSLNVSFDKKKGKYTGFSCWVYKNYGKERCTSHAIGWKTTMNQLVLEDIRCNAKAAKLATSKYKDMIIAAKTEKKKQETEKCKRELKTIEKRITELDKIMNKLYEDLALEQKSSPRSAIKSCPNATRKSRQGLKSGEIRSLN
ncbi:MAG: recombinase zinc beta ribbon domain-containing protein [Bacillota bacterium]